MQSLFNASFERSKYVQLDSGYMRRCLEYYDRHPTIRAAWSTCLHSVTSGGILLQRRKQIVGVNDVDNEEQKRLSVVWKEWCVAACRYLWSTGFAASCARYNAETKSVDTVLLDLSAVQIDYRRDEYNKSEFRYYARGDGLGGLEAKEIKRVTTIYFELPEATGQIRSVIASLLGRLTEFDVWHADAMKANSILSNPLFVVETPAQATERNPVYGLPPGVAGQPLAGSGAGSSADKETAAERMRNELYRSQVARSLNTYQGRVAMDERDPSSSRAALDSQLRLETGKKLAEYSAPVVSPNLVTMQNELERCIYQAFGIPYSMITGSSSSIGGVRSGSSNVRKLFADMQKSLQDKLAGYIECLWKLHHMPDHFVKYAKRRSRDTDKPRDAKSWHEEIDVSVTIPSIPDADVLLDLYERGFLKPAAFVKYMHQQHSIAYQDLDLSPVPPAHELQVQIMKEQSKLNLKIAEAAAPSSSASSTATPQKEKKKEAKRKKESTDESEEVD